MSDDSPIAAILERITMPETDAGSAERESLEPLGHIGLVLDWLGGTQGRWPPSPPRPVAIGNRTATSYSDIPFIPLSGDDGTPPGLLQGVQAAERAVDSGHDLILIDDVAPTTVGALALIALLTGADAASVMPTMLDSQEWMVRAAAVRDAMRKSRSSLGATFDVLEQLDDCGITGLCGVLLGASARRTPVILDSTTSLAAALAAHRIAYRARGWWWAAQRPAHPGADLAIERLDLHPFVDLHLDDEPGLAPVLVLQAVNASLSRCD